MVAKIELRGGATSPERLILTLSGFDGEALTFGRQLKPGSFVRIEYVNPDEDDSPDEDDDTIHDFINDERHPGLCAACGMPEDSELHPTPEGGTTTKGKR